MVEDFFGLGVREDGDRFYAALINRDSQYIRIKPGTGGVFPQVADTVEPDKTLDDVIPWVEAPGAASPRQSFLLAGGDDKGEPTAEDLEHALSFLDRIDDASLLVIPGVDAATVAKGTSYVDGKRLLRDMFYIADAPLGSVDDVQKFARDLAPKSQYAALYWPWVRVADPYLAVSGATQLVPPSGMIAGLYARTDQTRGVWTAPAGAEATLSGAVEVAVQITDGDRDALNDAGVNCLIRSFASAETVVWGSRTLSAQHAPEDRSIGAQRTAMFLQTSLYRGTHHGQGGTWQAPA